MCQRRLNTTYALIPSLFIVLRIRSLSLRNVQWRSKYFSNNVQFYDAKRLPNASYSSFGTQRIAVERLSGFTWKNRGKLLDR